MKRKIKGRKIDLRGKKMSVFGKKITLLPKISLLKQQKEDTDDRLPEHSK